MLLIARPFFFIMRTVNVEVTHCETVALLIVPFRKLQNDPAVS